MDFIRIITRQISFKSAPSTGVDNHHQQQESNVVVVPKLKQYTLKEVAQHCTINSCWMVILDKVYDLTDFIEYHPGGYEIMLEYGGSDATNAFNEKPHTLEAANMLEKYLIGELVKSDRLFS